MADDDRSEQSPFALNALTKEQRLERLRQRLAAATPPTRAPVREKMPVDGRRTLMAGVLIVIFVLAIVAGSGVFR